MEIEYEATFLGIEEDEIRNKLKQVNAVLVRPSFLQKRIVFDLPRTNEIESAWVRLRDEGNKITLTFKIVSGDKIEGQKEIGFNVDDFEKARGFLKVIGCRERAFQENKRELWKVGDTEITIDEWPFLEPYIEIEGDSESSVKNIAEKLGLDYKKALFVSTDVLYKKKYNVDIKKMPELVFNMPNPF